MSEKIPLPPLAEQRRIVTKLEELLGKVDGCRRRLEKIPVLLKRFRQSILAKAFRGELVPQDPDDEPASVLLERIRAEELRSSPRAQRRGFARHEEEKTTPRPAGCREVQPKARTGEKK